MSEPQASAPRGQVWAITVIGGFVVGLLGLWVQNVTTDLRQMIKEVSRAQATIEAHLDGHPGRVEERVGRLERSIAELGADIRVIRERIAPPLDGGGK